MDWSVMQQDTKLPQILAQAIATCGLTFQLRKDPSGVLEVPELDNVLISIHLGVPARLACRRDGKRFSGSAVHGDIDIIPAQMAARWEMQDENDTAILLSLPPTLLQAVSNESELDTSKLEIHNRFQIRDMELETLSLVVKREIEMGCPTGRLYLDGLALAIASRLVAQHSSLAGPRAHKNGGLNGPKLKRVLAFIEDQLAEDLSLEQIAVVAGVSASHVKTQFRKSVGAPLHQYVIQRRVDRAKELLAKGDLSMAEIAQATGFSHQSHLARHMRRVLGASPRAIQRRLDESLTEPDLSANYAQTHRNMRAGG
jgi:AraC family transcriptional regulator